MNRKRELTIYVGLYEDHAIKVIESFQKETGIKVSYVSLSNGEIFNRIRAEREKPGSSVWFGGPSETFIHARKEGLLRSYFSKNAEFIDTQYKDRQGYWTGIYVGSIAFVSNKAWLQENGLAYPHSWEDLLKPQYKGMITMPDPRTSGTGYTILGTLVQLLGEDEAFLYLEKLHEQVNSYPTSGSVPGRYVGSGQAGAAIMFSHDAVKFYKEGFHDIFVSFPEEGTGYEIGAVAIIKGAPQLEEAKLFVDWVLKREIQELGKKVGNFQIPTNREALPPDEAYHLEDLNVIQFDHQWAGENRERLLKRWVKEVLKK
ncbi:ABC transporter substrate-binding protein [Neobacillus notoginsengisoli]|nr:ABC transporter substrate-binding protein [Neobacillus notoginsengisoli]